MNRTGIILAILAIFAVLYLVITKADTALSKGQSALKQQAVTPEQQAQDIIDQGLTLPQE